MVFEGGRVVAVCRSPEHGFSKDVVEGIELLAGLGVEGDAHCGEFVKHCSRVAKDPTQPNLRQVHFLPAELFDEVAQAGFDIRPGMLGENVTTRGIDLYALPEGALIRVGSAAVRVTGLRNPCKQIEAFRAGLLAKVVSRGDDDAIIRRAGVMGVVVEGGAVASGDALAVELPPKPWRELERV